MIARFNLILLAILVACALAVVTSQHKARKLYVDLQKEQELAKQDRKSTRLNSSH